MAKPDRQKFTAGVVLVLIGLGFYLVQRLEAIGDEIIMLVIGAAFLVAYFYQKAYGLLVPACLLLGLGLGALLHDRWWWAHEGTQLGLGVGFVAIYVIDRLYRRRSYWWPLIPGVILVVIGIPKTAMVIRFLKDNWALVLVAIGVLVLIGAFRGRNEPEARPASPPEPPPSPPEPQAPVEPKVE